MHAFRCRLKIPACVWSKSGSGARWEDSTMRWRCVSLLIAFAVATCFPAQARQDRPADRAAAADHRRCLKNGFKPGSARYAACRDQLARRRAAEQDENRGWLFQSPQQFNCKLRGYKPGTAAFEQCLRWAEQAEGQRKHMEEQERQRQEQATNCLRFGSGIITPLGGSTFSVTCPGRIFICPGDINCPTCPGSIGCPPK